MDRKIYFVAVLALLAVAAASFGVSARDLKAKNQSLSCAGNDLVGAIVENSKGDVIGIVNQVENDGGQSFAILNHGPDSYYGEGGGFTPVPISALKAAQTDKFEGVKTLVLNKTEKQLEAAPAWNPPKMNNRQYEAKIDRFFGAQPTLCG